MNVLLSNDNISVGRQLFELRRRTEILEKNKATGGVDNSAEIQQVKDEIEEILDDINTKLNKFSIDANGNVHIHGNLTIDGNFVKQGFI
jgi:hypothetical protein